ncbi:MAG: DNA (cytosine-5-)-methyltransferase [Clostridia bacterium]|nr:DNA (cytosine-5-)-methyltransferase [Clostridia bacterium]
MSKSKLTLGSLFDGSGGFPLGGLMCGIKPIWASEIEPFAIRITTKRLPFMKHLGDINEINGSQIDPVDIITFGSPCQDMSIAGKREGLSGSRSGLFYEAIRVIKEMRRKTNGKYPRYCLWENVPGALSSNKGEDFKNVLESICQIKEDVSASKPEKWSNAGKIVGDNFSLAWRVLDARYFGVPQRRKRIYLVADFDGDSAGKILFESEGLSGYSAESFRAWQRTAESSGNSAEETVTVCLNDQGGQRMDVTENETSTLRAEGRHPPLVFENHSQDTRYKGPIDVAQTVLSTFGNGGNNQPFVLEMPTVYALCSKNSNSMKSNNPHSGIYKADTSRTLDENGGNPACNQGGMVVLEGGGTRPSHHGNGYKEADTMYTLNTVEMHGVAYGIDRSTFNMGQNAQFGITVKEESAPTVVAKGPGAVSHPIYTTSKSSYHVRVGKNMIDTLMASDYKDPPTVSENPYYIVRRLMPTECAKLQGFPSWWCENLETENPSEDEIGFWKQVFDTHSKIMGKSKSKNENQIIKWLKNPHSDTAEYKLWGNGVALPCVYFVLSGIAYFGNKEQ